MSLIRAFALLALLVSAPNAWALCNTGGGPNGQEDPGNCVPDPHEPGEPPPPPPDPPPAPVTTSTVSEPFPGVGTGSGFEPDPPVSPPPGTGSVNEGAAFDSINAARSVLSEGGGAALSAARPLGRPSDAQKTTALAGNPNGSSQSGSGAKSGSALASGTQAGDSGGAGQTGLPRLIGGSGSSVVGASGAQKGEGTGELAASALGFEGVGSGSRGHEQGTGGVVTSGSGSVTTSLSLADSRVPAGSAGASSAGISGEDAWLRRPGDPSLFEIIHARYSRSSPKVLSVLE